MTILKFLALRFILIFENVNYIPLFNIYKIRVFLYKIVLKKIGKNCMIGGQVGIIGHLKIGDNVKIQAQAGVTSDVDSNARITGTPAISHMSYNKSYIHFKNLPEIVKKIDKKD